MLYLRAWELSACLGNVTALESVLSKLQVSPGEAVLA